MENKPIVKKTKNGNVAGEGRLIVFEGIDGAGKTTQINMICARLKEDGRRVTATAEPTEGPVGGLIREALEGVTARTECEMATLFTADRVAHNVNPAHGIRKLVNDGYIVISDRYYYSTLAYQGSATDFDWVRALNCDCPDIRTPDLCVFLDLTPQASMERIGKNRVNTEIYENEKKLAEVRENFMRTFAALPDRVVVINADRPIEAVAEDVYRAVYAIL